MHLCYVLDAFLWHENWVLGRDLASLNYPDSTSLLLCLDSRKLGEQDFLIGFLSSGLVSFCFSSVQFKQDRLHHIHWVHMVQLILRSCKMQVMLL